MKWYVYELVDPRDDSAFYVGKGCGSRMWAHFRKSASENVKAAIKVIRTAGLEPFPRAIAYFTYERDALRFEAQRIRELTPLANIRPGHARSIPKPPDTSLFGTVFGLLLGREKDTWSARQRLHGYRRAREATNLHIQLIDIGFSACDRLDAGFSFAGK